MLVRFTQMGNDGEHEPVYVNADAVSRIESDAGATRVWLGKNEYVYVEESVEETVDKLNEAMA